MVGRMPPFYLTTEPGGRLFYADGLASEGVTLNAVAPEAPFPSRGLLAAETPADALRSPHISWPCELWRVEGTPDKKGSREMGGTLSRFDALQVVSAEDPELVFGPNRALVISFFASIKDLRACDLHLAATLEEEYYATHDDADEDSPCYLALAASHRLAEKVGLSRAQEVASGHAQKLAKHAAEQLFDVEFLPERREEPYGKLKMDLQNAAYCAASALVVREQLSAQELALITDDWSRLTGRSAIAENA